MAKGTISSTSLKRHVKDTEGCSSLLSHKYGVESECEAKEALLHRELEEAKARAVQMSKTMQWWSDCTANWREKWAKVRNERNLAKEEAKQYRLKFDQAIKDLNKSKSDQHELQVQNEQLKGEIERVHALMFRHVAKFDSQLFDMLEHNNGEFLNVESISSKPECDVFDVDVKEFNELPGAAQSINVKQTAAMSELSNTAHDLMCISSDAAVLNDAFDSYDVLLKKCTVLECRLVEANKIMEIERQENINLKTLIERTQMENAELKLKYDEVEVKSVGEADGCVSREDFSDKLADLRNELEKLQMDNAIEWGKREHLQTEKFALERENKKLRAEIKDLQEKLDKVQLVECKFTSPTDSITKKLQLELNEKNKEIMELQDNRDKYKKQLQDKVSEIAHLTRRSEQYEAEVKSLRVRVEQLKKNLTSVEDQLDSAQDVIRKFADLKEKSNKSEPCEETHSEECGVDSCQYQNGGESVHVDDGEEIHVDDE